jgi:microcystin-dependent protein
LTVETTRSAAEGDMYLDTNNNDYRIGLTHGKLGLLTDNQNLDSASFKQDTLKVYIENGNVGAVDLSSLRARGTNVGDIKCGIQTTDHYGWYLMDGRVLGSLPAAAQANAATLGIVGSLPDASNRVIKTKTGAEALLSTGGNAAVTLVQANLPSYNLVVSGATSSSGNHTHTATLSDDGLHNHTAVGADFGLEEKGFSNSGSAQDTALVTGATNAFSTDLGGKHIHTSTINASGSHTHTVSTSSGGGDVPFDLYQPYMVTNRFIYLEQ